MTDNLCNMYIWRSLFSSKNFSFVITVSAVTDHSGHSVVKYFFNHVTQSGVSLSEHAGNPPETNI